MLISISNELVRGYEDREELRAIVAEQIVTAPSMSAAAVAAALLSLEDGDPTRGLLYDRCRKLGYNAARKMRTVKARELPCDYDRPIPTGTNGHGETVGSWYHQQVLLANEETPVQAAARMAALRADGRATRLDKDSATWVNWAPIMANWHPPMTKPVQAWSDMEFHRSAERMHEQSTGGWSKVAVGNHWSCDLSRGQTPTKPSNRGQLAPVFNKGFTRLVRERNLSSLLVHEMRTHGLHDLGRLDRVDKLTFSHWYERFVNMEPDPEIFKDKDAQSFVKEFAARCRLAHTPWFRHAAARKLIADGCKLTEHGWLVHNDDEAALAAIADGHVFSVGSLVEACTSATKQKSRGNKHATGEAMVVRWATMLRLMGFEPDRMNRERLAGIRSKNPKTRRAGLVERMAIAAGASGTVDMLADSSITLDRF
jgi:hypothetical protein